MTFIKPTSNYNPFATSTAFGATGATAYNQAWVSVSGAVATINGKAISTTAGQSLPGGGSLARYYYNNHNDYALSGMIYYQGNQSTANSSDEAICVDNSFELLNVVSMDSTVSRTNIIKLEN